LRLCLNDKNKHFLRAFVSIAIDNFGGKISAGVFDWYFVNFAIKNINFSCYSQDEMCVLYFFYHFIWDNYILCLLNNLNFDCYYNFWEHYYLEIYLIINNNYEIYLVYYNLPNWFYSICLLGLISVLQFLLFGRS
jgi:hypothetical protein